MPSLLGVLSNTLWILGLSGVLATVSYVNWYRFLHRRSWQFVLSTPRLLFPLCLSITLICAGAAMAGRFGADQAAWQETLVWGALAAVFAGQSIAYYMAGHKNGWDTSTEGMVRP
jgi:hypothetical protein